MRTGQWAGALDWWKKVDEAHRLTLEDRRDFVGAALNVGDTPIAARQLEVLLAQRTGTEPHDILLAGQVAARQSDPMFALDYAERVLADKGTRPYDFFRCDAHFLVTSPYSPPYANAWQQTEAVARDPRNPGSLDALALLARKRRSRPCPRIGGNTSLSLESLPAQSPTPPSSSRSFPGAHSQVDYPRRSRWAVSSPPPEAPWTRHLNQHPRRNPADM